jgi:hypothetical protein
MIDRACCASVVLLPKQLDHGRAARLVERVIS